MAQFTLFQEQGDRIVTGLRCSKCALASNPALQTNCMQGEGPVGAKYMFVGGSPGAEDDGIGKPMSGSYGRQLWSLLAECGFRRDEVYLSNAVKCASHGTKVTKQHWDKCKEHLLREIERVRPEVIIAVGTDAAAWLTGQSGVHRLRRTRLSLGWDRDTPVYTMRQPTSLTKVYDQDRVRMRASMVQDLGWLRQQVRNGQHHKKWEELCDYQTARTHEDIERFFAELEQQDGLSVDLETSDLIHTQGDILAIGFSWAKGVSRAIPLHARGVRSYFWWEDGYVENYIVPRLKSLLERKTVFGQNFLQFDQKWIREKLGVVRCNIDFDCQLGDYILDEEGRHDLETLSQKWLGLPPWKSEFSFTDTEQLCTYMCKDTDTAWQIRKTIEPMLDEQQTWLLQNLLIPLGHELMEMEWLGVRVDESALVELDKYLTREIASALADFRQFSEVAAFEFQQGAAINLNSTKQVGPLFRDYFKLAAVGKTKGGSYSTDAEWQEQHKDHVAVQALQKYRRLDKLHGTYCTGLLKKSRNGRIHTSFKETGPVTGRLASKDPNLQNIPRDDTAGKVLEDPKAIKKVFAADPGYVIIQGDLSQAELRVLASVSGDKNLIDIYQRGEDAHTSTAAKVHGVSLDQVTKAQRSSAKAINFGVIYGKHRSTLIADFLAAGNTEDEAVAFYDGHQRTFPDVWRWMNEQERTIRSTMKQRTHFGRTRHYQEIDDRAIRQAYNFPIQSLASDITLLGIVALGRRIRELGLAANIILTVHDSIIVQAHESCFWETALLVKDTMEGIRYPWMKVPMVADIEAGYSWGTLKEIDPKKRCLK